jgi:6-phosphogluconolactonase
MPLRSVTALSGLLGLLCFVGCGSTHHAVSCSATNEACSSSSLVYATTSANELLLFPIGQNGGLEAANSLLPGPSIPAGIAVSPPSRELFVADDSGDKLLAFNVQGSTYSSAPGSPYALGSSEGSLQSVTATAHGKFVYVLALNGGVFGFSIGSNGQLTAIPGSPFPGLSQSVASVTDASDKFLFVVSGSSVSVFTIDSTTGVLTAVQTALPLAGTNLATIGMAATTPGNFLYIALSGSNAVAGFSFDTTTGALTQISGSPFAVGKAPLTLTATANALYVVNSGEQTISALSWSSTTGRLSEIPGSPFSAPLAAGTPASLSNQYFYVSSIQSGSSPPVNAILGFRIGSSGTLTPVVGSPFNATVPLTGGLAVF